MKYLINAIINFEVEADSRAEAHIEAANRLIEADLSGFDLAKLAVSGSIDITGRGRPPTVTQNSGDAVDTSGEPDIRVNWSADDRRDILLDHRTDDEAAGLLPD